MLTMGRPDNLWDNFQTTSKTLQSKNIGAILTPMR
jgi:hypothetical protein